MNFSVVPGLLIVIFPGVLQPVSPQRKYQKESTAVAPSFAELPRVKGVPPNVTEVTEVAAGSDTVTTSRRFVPAGTVKDESVLLTAYWLVSLPSCTTPTAAVLTNGVVNRSPASSASAVIMRR